MRTVFIERLKIPAKWLWIIEIEEKKTDQKNVRCFSSLSLEDHFSHGILMKRIKNRKIMKIKKKLVIDYLLSWLQWHGWLWELNVVNKVWRNNEWYLQLFAKVIWNCNMFQISSACSRSLQFVFDSLHLVFTSITTFPINQTIAKR